MKHLGILNRHLLDILARLGHMDMIAITDRGFPLVRHSHTTNLDLSISPNIPRFLDVLFPIIDEMHIEGVIFAEETQSTNPEMIQAVRERLASAEHIDSPVPERFVSHTAFKHLVLQGGREEQQMVSLIRTGEFQAYTNIILIAGVAF